MRIVDIKTVLLTGPCTNDPFVLEIRQLRSAAFIEIYTDVGMIGVGETYAGYFCPEIVPHVVAFYAPILIGCDIESIDDLWERMNTCGTFWGRVGLGSIVLCGIEAALWDLKGKLEDQPAYRLLGGQKHDHLPCYATGGPSNYPLETLQRKVEHYRSLGFKSIKIGAGRFTVDYETDISIDPQEAADCEVEKLSTLRQVFGSDLGIALDGHMNDTSPNKAWTLDVATEVLKACEPYDLLFFEEALPYKSPAAYVALRQATDVPVAGGECLTSMAEWQAYLEAEAFDIGQPDASFTSGLRPVTAIAKALQNTGCNIAPHAWGAGGSLMQNIHVGFACENTCIVEVPPDYGPLHDELIRDSLRIKDGLLLPPDKPGLGIELTATTKQRYPFIPGSGEIVSVPGKVQKDQELLRA